MRCCFVPCDAGQGLAGGVSAIVVGLCCCLSVCTVSNGSKWVGLHGADSSLRWCDLRASGLSPLRLLPWMRARRQILETKREGTERAKRCLRGCHFPLPELPWLGRYPYRSDRLDDAPLGLCWPGQHLRNGPQGRLRQQVVAAGNFII